MLTGSNDKTAKLWDARTGQQMGAVMEHRDDVDAAEWSPDGTRVATVAGGGIRIWNGETGQAIGAPSSKIESSDLLKWSPDGTRVLVGGTNGAQILDARTGLPVSTRLKHVPSFSANIESAAWSPDGLRVVTGSRNSGAVVWDVPLLPAGDAARAAEVAELTCGFRVNEDGALVSVGDWQARSARLQAIRDELASRATPRGSLDLVRWFLADPSSRTVSPVSSLSIDEVRRTQSSPRRLRTTRSSAKFSGAPGAARIDRRRSFGRRDWTLEMRSPLRCTRAECAILDSNPKSNPGTLDVSSCHRWWHSRRRPRPISPTCAWSVPASQQPPPCARARDVRSAASS